MTYQPSSRREPTDPAAHAQPSEQQPWEPPPRAPYQYKYLQPPGHRPPSTAQRWVRRVLLFGVAVLSVALIGTIVLQQRVANAVRLADVRTDRPAGGLLMRPMNILLLGVDLRPQQEAEGIRSDSLLVLHLEPNTARGSLLSIPRDSVATIPGVGDDKINAAFAYGYSNAEQIFGAGTDPSAAGAALAADTVEQFLGMGEHNARIDYVATINFDGFAQMIDALGGITVDVPRQIVDDEYPTEDFGVTTIRFDAGVQRMNGEQALQYVRTRHADNDFGRAERQQQVVQAMVQALKAQPLLLRPITALRLADAAGNAVRTTLPVGRPDALLLGLGAARIDPAQLTTYRISPDTVRLQERGSDLLWNGDDVAELTGEFLKPPEPAAASPSPSSEQATVQVQNGAGVGGAAAQVSEQIQAAGFTLAAPNNAASTARSQIIDYGGHPRTRQRLSALLNDMPIIERPAAEAPDGVNIVVLLGADYTSFVPNR